MKKLKNVHSIIGNNLKKEKALANGLTLFAADAKHGKERGRFRTGCFAIIIID